MDSEGERMAQETLEAAKDSLELQKLKEEKARLLNNTKDDDEVKQLKREIFLMKNPVFRIIGKISGAVFTGAANLGDAVIKATINFLRPRPNQPNQNPSTPADVAAPAVSRQVIRADRKKKKRKNKKSKQSRRPAPAPARRAEPPAKPKGVDERISDVMTNIEKEIGKFDKF